MCNTKWKKIIVKVNFFRGVRQISCWEWVLKEKNFTLRCAIEKDIIYKKIIG